MKKISLIAGIIVAVMAIDLLLPRLEIEDHMAGFLKHSLSKLLHWINFRSWV